MSKPKQESLRPNFGADAFLGFYRAIRAAKRALDDATASYRLARKGAKNAGCDLAALALLESLAKLDEQEATMRLSTTLRYAAWANIPVGTQLDMFNEARNQVADDLRESEAVFAAREAGERAGRTGQSRTEDNPHEAGTAAAVAWDEGFSEGEAFIAEQTRIAEQMGLPAKVKPARTTRKRRDAAKAAA